MAVDANVKNVIELSNKNKEKLSKNEDIVINENINSKTKMTDYIKTNILFKYSHIFSDEIKKVICFYELDYVFYGVFIITNNTKQQYIYWKMDTSKIDSVLIEKIDKQKIFYLDKNNLNDRSIYLAKYERQEYLLIKEDIAESILRRCPIGIKFSEVKFID